MLETFSFFGMASSGIFAVVEPFGAIPMFAAVTRGRSVAQRERLALRASLVGASVLLVFALLGRKLLAALDIQMDAFRVAGGILLLLMALDMLRAKAGSCRCTPRELDEAASREDVALAPLAIPLLAGPGAMATVLVLMSRAPGFASSAAVLVAIMVTFAISYFVLRSASWVERVIGVAAMGAMQRVLGLLLAAMAVQTVAHGLRSIIG